MTTLRLSLAQKIAFYLQDESGVEVTGLAGTFTISVSKNGGAFAAGTGTKAEIGSGWYSYTLTAGETDTDGPLALKVTGTGVDQQNLLYQVSGSTWEAAAGANILSSTEAANVLRCETDDPDMLALLPLVDSYLEGATGRDWTLDASIYPQAKAAARMVLVKWHEDPGGMGGAASLGWGLSATITQLEALALKLALDGAPEEKLAILGHNMHTEMAITASLVVVFNHEMAAAATSAVTLEDSAGSTVAVSNSLDVTGKILTVNPTGSLTAESAYTVVIDGAADVYGQTIETQIGFRTA
jgi:hypothetical protein